MKKLTLLTLLVMFSINHSSGQLGSPYTYTPPGETIKKIWDDELGPGTDDVVVTTKEINEYTSGFYFIVYRAPEGVDIVDANPKFGMFEKIWLVLLSNGKTIQLVYTSQGWTEEPMGPISKEKYESFYEIVGDDMYVMGYKGVYVTRDNGKTWQIDTVGLEGSYLFRDIDMDSSQNVWLLTEKGLFMQPLTSSTWTKIPAGGTTFYQGLYVDHLQRIWLYGYGNTYVSTDGGNTINPGPDLPENAFISTVAVDSAGDLYIIASTNYNTETGNRVYRSVGGTQSATRIDQGLEGFFTMSDEDPYTAVGGSDTLMVGTMAGMFYSPDHGATWTYANGIKAEKVGSIVATADNTIIASTIAGVFKLKPGNAWEKVHPTNGFQPDNILFRDKNGVLYAQGEVMHNIPGSTAPVYAVRKSTDNGKTWLMDTLGGSQVAMNAFFVDETGVQHALGESWIPGTGPLIRAWKKEPGQAWVVDTLGLPSNLDFNYSPRLIGSDHAGNVYLVITEPSAQRATIYKRALSGTTWATEVTLHNVIIQGLTGHAGDVIVSTSKGLFKKEGSNYNAMPVPDGLDQNDVTYSLAEYGNGILWAHFITYDQVNNEESGKGIYYSTDLSTWKAISNDSMLIFTGLAPVGDSLFALASGYDGVWIFDTSGVTAIAPSVSALPSVLKVYPNPAKDEVHFEVEMKQSGDIRLHLTDLSGRIIADVAQGQYGAGTHTLRYSTSQLPAGNYLWLLQMGGESRTGKITVVK